VPEFHSPLTEAFQHRLERLVNNVASVVVTSSHNIRLSLLGLFCQGHVLLEDLPGVGKTLLAKTIAGSIEGHFSRIQFTPDLLPSDITGTSVLDLRHQTFEFVPGPIFANVVLADELNRAGPRTQSALLEAMAESQVSADGTVRPLPRPFMVIATQNMIESYGTFPLPNSQLDRFMVSMTLGLPTPEQEMEILQRAEHGLPRVTPMLTPDEVVQMQEVVMAVQVATSIRQYIVNLAGASRQCGYLAAGVSPRGSASLLRACQGWAAFQGRSFVIPEDVQELAPHVWGQRVLVSPDEGTKSGREAIGRLLKSVPVPL
jgi:MoxR-like ATPase